MKSTDVDRSEEIDRLGAQPIGGRKVGVSLILPRQCRESHPASAESRVAPGRWTAATGCPSPHRCTAKSTVPVIAGALRLGSRNSSGECHARAVLHGWIGRCRRRLVAYRTVTVTGAEVEACIVWSPLYCPVMGSGRAAVTVVLKECARILVGRRVVPAYRAGCGCRVRVVPEKKLTVPVGKMPLKSSVPKNVADRDTFEPSDTVVTPRPQDRSSSSQLGVIVTVSVPGAAGTVKLLSPPYVATMVCTPAGEIDR